MKGPRGTLHTATCLLCGWHGEGRTWRPAAVAEGEGHEREERHPWQGDPPAATRSQRPGGRSSPG
jgi:hypothetical protein